jgi:hypothetical protein
LDKIWPDVRDSRWAGDDRDGWERLPYWLDGFIPLAWMLDDEDLKARARYYVDRIIATQTPDGWLCPCRAGDPREAGARNHYDMWAFFLICKVLTRALHCAAKHIETNTLFNWGAARWFECLIPIFWLYEKTMMVPIE